MMETVERLGWDDEGSGGEMVWAEEVRESKNLEAIIMILSRL